VDLRDQLQSAFGDTYLLQRELTGGGMARVYLAQERGLSRTVVIKVLSSEVAAEVSAERFTREVKVAARLQHTNILPLLTAGTADGLPYYTMPYVEGESLLSRIRAGPLPVTDVASIIRDVARALGYAHTNGVIHRDIKPANVLISGDAAIVTDFGIAKAIAKALDGDTPSGDFATLTQLGTAIGTPAYMAPEQAAGDPASDQRADIYSLGAMAYELLTGRLPFSGTTPQQLLAAKMSGTPRTLTDLRPDTPPSLATLVMHCLERDPNDRPQSAAEVLAALGTGSGEVLRTVRGKSSRRRVTVVAALVVAAAGVTFVASRALGVGPFGSPLSSGAVTENGRVLVATFEGGSDSSLTSTVTELFRLAFAQSRSIRTVDPSTLGPALQRMNRPPNSAIDGATARELAVREGMTAVVEGRILGAPGSHVLTAKLIAADNGDVLASADETVRSEQDMIPAVGRLSAALRGELGESMKAVRATPPLERVSTTSLEALRKYTAALAADRLQDEGTSTALLREAVALDSNFAMAYRKLGNNLFWTRQRAQALEYLEKGYALRDRLTDIERNLMLGTYYSKVTADFTRAKAAFEAVLAVDPDNRIALDNVAYLAIQKTDYRRAEEIYQYIVKRWPTALAMTNLASTQDLMRKFAEADATYRAAIAISRPGGNLAPLNMGLFHFGTNRVYDSAEVYLRRAAAWPEIDNTKRVNSILGLAGVVHTGGRISEASALLRDAAAIEHGRGNAGGALLIELDNARMTLASSGNRRAALDQVNSIHRRVVQLPGDAWPIERLATMYVLLGQPKVAREIVAAHARIADASSALDLTRDSNLAAIIAGAEGRTDDAIAMLRRRIPEPRCTGCTNALMGFLFDKSGKPDSAIAAFTRHIDSHWELRLQTDTWYLAPVYKRLAELHEAKGNGSEAAAYFTKFADLWKRADPALQPAVQEARRRAEVLRSRS
jgi:serine/threonine-protein kinase